MTKTAVPSTPPAPPTPRSPADRIEQALAAGALTALAARVLLFERAHPAAADQGAKEHQVLADLGLSWTRYWQILNALIDTPAALAADPATITRLRRLREQRRGRRMPRPRPARDSALEASR
jgi:hypothetical protein